MKKHIKRKIHICVVEKSMTQNPMTLIKRYTRFKKVKETLDFIQYIIYIPKDSLVQILRGIK